MATIINVEKISVSKQMEKLYSITLKLTLMDGETELLNKNFTQRYRKGDNIETIIARLQVEMQEAIDDFKVETNIFISNQLDTAINTLKENLSV